MESTIGDFWHMIIQENCRTIIMLCNFVEGIELLLERIHHRRDASGVAVMRWLRDRRLGAIQKSIQFVFMHYAIIQLLCQEGVMKADNPKVIAFQEKYEKLLAKHTQTRKKAEKMLDVLQTQLDDDELLKQSGQKGSTLEKEDDDKKIAEDKQRCVNLQLEPDLYGDTNTGDKKEVHSSEYLELL
ncbi:hypothetical protein NECAME_03655 [Necator americanus]|uniref:Tyrosine-protein phosphatase domain-containing protein n=1 Tax=Necator americanus TaxID=51031 RepID=W2T4J8_NECAM|nr:hypothetical protein NECAME_03655 [Necator americanus]ETN75882.1 hypothetical protein NECAME_03655 [Necator americanus]